MTDTDKLAAEGRELLARATHAPWLRQGSFAIKAEDRGGMRVGMYPTVAQAYRTADADLIAWLRNNADTLLTALAERDALKAENERLRGQLALHPTGRCSCFGEGECQWCLMIEAKERAEDAESECDTLRALNDRMEGLIREHVDSFLSNNYRGRERAYITADMQAILAELDAAKGK